MACIGYAVDRKTYQDLKIMLAHRLKESGEVTLTSLLFEQAGFLRPIEVTAAEMREEVSGLILGMPPHILPGEDLLDDPKQLILRLAGELGCKVEFLPDKHIYRFTTV